MIDIERLRGLLDRGYLNDALRSIEPTYYWLLRPNITRDGFEFLTKTGVYHGTSPIEACLSWVKSLDEGSNELDSVPE